MRTGSPRHATFKGRHDAEYTWFSLADNLPFLSMDVERAARRILNAVRYGNSHVVLSLPAKVADKVHGLFPGLTSDALGLANRLLPGMESHENGVEGQHCRPVVAVPWLIATLLPTLVARLALELGYLQLAQAHPVGDAVRLMFKRIVNLPNSELCLYDAWERRCGEPG
jgi:hypothetical protein